MEQNQMKTVMRVDSSPPLNFIMSATNSLRIMSKEFSAYGIQFILKWESPLGTTGTCSDSFCSDHSVSLFISL